MIINFNISKAEFMKALNKIQRILCTAACMFIVFAALLLHSCKEELVEPPVDLGFEYFPLKTGHWVVYQVDSISYDEFTSKVDTFSFQRKQVVGENFYDNSNRESFKIEHYFRESDSSSWHLASMGYVTKTPERIEQVENNVRYIPLVFPVRIGLSWNGNAYNTFKTLLFKFTDAHVPYVAGGQLFDSCAFILQEDEVSLISRDFGTEIYARNCGLVYKKATHLVKEINGSIKSGVDYSYTIIDYRK